MTGILGKIRRKVGKKNRKQNQQLKTKEDEYPFPVLEPEDLTAQADSHACDSGIFHKPHSNDEKHHMTMNSPHLLDLADQPMEKDLNEVSTHRVKYIISNPNTTQTRSAADYAVDPAIQAIRDNLPPDPLLSTPFGLRRMTYADYTASGRSLKFVEDYITRVIGPMYANTHTETSASGLQTTHAREEARRIIMESLNANPKEYDLIFTGSGVTAAIWKLIALLGIHCPKQLQLMTTIAEEEGATTVNEITDPIHGKPLILISHAEHHSNELMWQETIGDVIPIPPDDSGSLDLEFLERVLKENQHKYKHIIGSFTAGSNVTGLLNPIRPTANLLHKYGGYICFDYAGAGPYKRMNMEPVGVDKNSADEYFYLDAIFVSPHKFVGGPGTPGLLCVRKDFATCRDALQHPPTIAGGGTVTMVWPSDVDPTAETNRRYEQTLHAREEAGTPGIVESIRCGLAFHVRDNLVGIDKIEAIEGSYAKRAVERLRAKNIWVMGDDYSNITSEDRLSITSFNVWCTLPNNTSNNLTNDSVPASTLAHPQHGRPLMLHPHFVAALLNDLYGIQARSGCACAGPLAFRLFGRYFPFMTKEAICKVVGMSDKEFHSLKPGWCRVNFNYFIDEEEFDYICSAIEQIAEHGWKLLPLYALCMKTGQYWFNGVLKDKDDKLTSFNRFDAVRTLKEMQLDPASGGVTWYENPTSNVVNRQSYLDKALQVYDNAPALVRQMLFRYRDLRRKDVKFPADLEEYRFFALGSEVIHHLGIEEHEIEAERSSLRAKNSELNPMNVAHPVHDTANPMSTMDRPRG